MICPFCGMKYSDFKTGFTYQDIFDMLWSNSDDPKLWVNKRRNAVLGKWHEIKLNLWESHLEQCEYFKKEVYFE